MTGNYHQLTLAEVRPGMVLSDVLLDVQGHVLLPQGTVRLCWTAACLVALFAAVRVAHRVLKSVLFAWKMEATAGGHLKTVESRTVEMMPAMTADANPAKAPAASPQA